MAVLVGRKQLALLERDDVPGRVTAVLLSLPGGNDSALADTRLTLDPLQPEAVVEARSGEQRLVLALEECPRWISSRTSCRTTGGGWKTGGPHCLTTSRVATLGSWSLPQRRRGTR